MLLERAQTEVFSVKQKLDNDLKQEKKQLRQKLTIKRRREMLLKVCKELLFVQRSEHPPVRGAWHCPQTAGSHLVSGQAP